MQIDRRIKRLMLLTQMLSGMLINAFSQNEFGSSAYVASHVEATWLSLHRDSVPSLDRALVNLGPQVAAARIFAGAFIKTADGRDMLFTVVNGKPGHLLGYDVTTGRLQVDMALQHIDGARSLTVSDGWVYIAGADGGYLSRYNPTGNILEELGKPIPLENYVWDVTSGRNGEVFGATYPGCRVFRYHPKEEFSDIGRGAIVEEERYVHSVAYDARTNKLYAGVGSHTYLVEIDIKTGVRRELLPQQYRGKAGFVTPVRIVRGIKGGDRLLANVVGKTLVYNLKTGDLEHEIKAIDVRSVVKSPSGNEIFYTDASGMHSWDLSKTTGPVKVVQMDHALIMYWDSDGDLLALTKNNSLVRYNPQSQKIHLTSLDIPMQPVHIRLTQAGPDGRIWTTGYPVGSNAAYDPSTGKTERFQGLSQAESMTVQGTRIYFGNYPGAKIHVYDTERPWRMEEGNPKRVAVIPGQDRPFAAVSVSEHDMMFFGTVPHYGEHGGVLVEYNTRNEEMHVFSDVVARQSVVSLAYAGGIVVGGTSINGGMGTVPEASEAKLFGWNVTDREKLFEVAPVAGAKTVDCLINGPDGNVWGVADGTLFIFDASKRKVISRHPLFEKAQGRWINVKLVVHPSGQVYGTGNNELFRIDPDSKTVTTLLKDAAWISMDGQGRLYFVRSGTALWQFTPEAL